MKVHSILSIYIDEKYIVQIILNYKKDLEKLKKKKRKKCKNNKKKKISERRILRLNTTNLKLNLFR